MRTLALILFAATGAAALAQGLQPQPGRAPGAFAQRGESSIDRRLAALEEQATAIAAEIKALRAELKKGSEFKIARLKHTGAVETSRLLNEIFAREGVRVSVDERTNSLIFYAAKERLEVIEALIARLDVEIEKK